MLVCYAQTNAGAAGDTLRDGGRVARSVMNDDGEVTLAGMPQPEEAGMALDELDVDRPTRRSRRTA